MQKLGREKEAQIEYTEVLKYKPKDIGSLAIASNNLVVLNREHNVFDSKKKLKSTLSDELTAKLNTWQLKKITLNHGRFALITNQVLIAIILLLYLVLIINYLFLIFIVRPMYSNVWQYGKEISRPDREYCTVKSGDVMASKQKCWSHWYVEEICVPTRTTNCKAQLHLGGCKIIVNAGIK